MKYFRIVSIVALLLSLAGVNVTAGPKNEAPAESSQDTFSGPPKSLYLQLVDGLHVTGEKIDVDIETYRLRVTGDVENSLSLSFQDLKEMEPVTKFLELNCPGFFTDRGDWTGVPVSAVLNQAKPGKFASIVEFISVDGGYIKRLLLDEVMEDRFLLAYAFDGREFPPIHGFPLRLAAENEEGNVWVKWLGEIRVVAGGGQ